MYTQKARGNDDLGPHDQKMHMRHIRLLKCDHEGITMLAKIPNPQLYYICIETVQGAEGGDGDDSGGGGSDDGME
jgi:hypothetical protein